MQLITLNTWAGKVYAPLIAFVKKLATQTDIFCFQEILFGHRPEVTLIQKARINLYEELEKTLPDFVGFPYLAPDEARYFIDDHLDDNAYAGQAVFIKKHLTVMEHGGFRGYEEQNPAHQIYSKKMTGSCQWIEIQEANETITILNLHGLWQKGTRKADTPERLVQSQIINRFLSDRKGKKILCGDFNLLPEGESIRLLELHMNNLIRTFGITSTRSELYTGDVQFADYILTSPDIIINNFSVLPDIVSDHLPLLLEFT
jgi:endonuclease/exonuclease/phosphatase family metal-dependent hydrolase